MSNIGRSVILLLLIFPNLLSAFQDQSVVAWIEKEPIYSGEFLYAFNKNRDPNELINEDSLFAYLDQYLNFKLKVLAAELNGIGGTNEFKKEYSAYISEIKKPYLQNPDFEEELIKEAYQRLQFEVRAAHILVRIPKNPTPKDTLNAFNQVSSIRARAMAGEDFGELAKKNSQDGSAQSGGDLGYFTGFGMVYPFETAAFETSVGEISKVVRTQFGYHLVKVIDKRPARGRVKTSHIFVSSANKSSTRASEIIRQAYDSLQNGSDWRLVCTQFSEDSRTKTSGGSLPYYGVGQFPEPLLNKAFSLSAVGDFSEPVQSQFGWHILKLDAKEPIQDLTLVRTSITDRVKRSGRNQLDKQGLLKKLKAENGFSQDTSQINQTIKSIAEAEESWPAPEDVRLFSIGTKEVSDKDLILYLDKTYPAPTSLRTSIWKAYEQFEFDQITAYEDSLIPEKYPQHQYLINEYRQGLLLFEIMETQVWNKALEDSVGLVRFHGKHSKDYVAPERAQVFVISSDSLAILEGAKALISQMPLNTDLSLYLKGNMKTSSYALLKIVKRRFEQKDLPIFAGTAWKSGSLVSESDFSSLYWIKEIIPPGFYDLDEIKGLVISDYQDFLEKQWVKKLRSKHKIKINKKAIKAIASRLE